MKFVWPIALFTVVVGTALLQGKTLWPYALTNAFVATILFVATDFAMDNIGKRN